jgi:DNA-binding MarR family transcriptional regulator
MEQRGLVRRERDTRDRRIYRIWLTDAGKQLREELPPVALDISEQAMKGISRDDRERFSEILDQAIANLS